MIPLSQAVMLDMYPPQQIGQVMAIWGAGTLLGPIFGPLIGGWITQDFSWRWAFYINLPVGLVAFACVWFFMSPDPGKRGRPFDFLGYGALITFIAGLQLALDRGPTQDWFASPEVWTEAICSAIGLYVFIMQTVTARQPFFDRALGLNRNFIFCNLYSVVIGVLLFATMALQPPLMQQLLGYPVLGAGLVMMPRGIGSVISMLIVGRLVGKIDTRLLMVGGLALSALAMLQMSHFDLSMTTTPFITSGLLQGFATGFMFVPMTAMAFATLEPRLRPDATSVFATVRSLGQAVGISIMEAVYTNQAAVAHGDLSAAVQPSNPALAAGLPANLNPLTLGGLEGLNGEVTRQASMVGYVDVFRLMFFGAILVMPMVLVLRPPKSAPVTTEIAVD
jgi:DHA2 family multidrug resistance protein